MPIGNAYATGSIISFIERYHVKNKELTVLDVGCGIGHNGFIFREMFEVRYCRLKPEDWMHQVEAIEVFEDYRNPVWDYVYNNVMISDCLEQIPLLGDNKYDIIFATELLEHFKKKEVHFLLKKLIKKLTPDGTIIVTIPLGTEEAVLSQKDVFGNIHEVHRSHLTIKDFERYYIRHKVNDGVFMIGRTMSADVVKCPHCGADVP